ncbi:auxin-responsive protein SAUR63-like [Hevea brasiliensis]|uniref:auxin-responsive protein SAUR63-like n=1 Tax=Hevea brasiliensis TaxID=3981 RepID=UPI0025F33FEB|nr:auxin-responsive protein SAUR63-like [Hevea brasiliensis]
MAEDGFSKGKAIALPSDNEIVDAESCCAVEKGHSVVYSIDQTRFVLPLEYLDKDIVKELFELAEEEFGLARNSPLILPCDAGFMEYIIDLSQWRMTKDVEKALLISMASIRCSSFIDPHQAITSQQLPICSF